MSDGMKKFEEKLNADTREFDDDNYKEFEEWSKGYLINWQGNNAPHMEFECWCIDDLKDAFNNKEGETWYASGTWLREKKPSATPEDDYQSYLDEEVAKGAIRVAKATISDPVDHPKHYTSHPSGIECIDITKHMSFNLGNALKYIWRADLKGKAIEDLKKAKWYLEKELEMRDE